LDGAGGARVGASHGNGASKPAGGANGEAGRARRKSRHDGSFGSGMMIVVEKKPAALRSRL
jgi:hypothetical protein